MTFVWLFMGAPLRVQSTGTLSERGFDLSCASVLTYDAGAATIQCTMAILGLLDQMRAQIGSTLPGDAPW